jgi:flagellum-specific ATP synthase
MTPEAAAAAGVARARLRELAQAVAALDPVERSGRVLGAIGLTVEARCPGVQVGDLCRLEPPGILAECIGFRDDRVLLMRLEDATGLAPGARAVAVGRRLLAPCGEGLLGRVLDGLGRPLDGAGPLQPADWRPVEASAPPPLTRTPIHAPLFVGVRAIDACLTCGRGQRVGLFAGSGVGKSTLLGMLARGTAADVNVIALVGERGREVREFLEDDLGAAALRRSVVVVATSDQPALCRIKAALVATTIAESFRDAGRSVLLLMDSLTRYAMAWREVGLARGEPPTSRGYTPSVFAALPRLLERAGTGPVGSITAFYTVLVEGDDLSEPIADAARSILDGHVVLSRALAEAGHLPPIDVLQSVSRLMPRVADADHQAAAQALRRILATYQQAADLIDIGAYQSGHNPELDRAVAMIADVRAFLRQGVGEAGPWPATREALLALARRAAA